MTKEEKREQFAPKRWSLYCNDVFVASFASHTEAKHALYNKCEEIKKHPRKYRGKYYTIKPDENDTGRETGFN